MASESARLRVVKGGQSPASAAEVAPSSPAEALSDSQLVALSLSEDPAGFEALYRRHATFALNLAVRLQGASYDVEDIVHDAFVRAFSRLDELREAAAFRSWLGAIVVRLVRSRLRRRRLLGTLGLANGTDPVDLDAIASQDADPESRAQLAQVYALLQTMPLNERIAWTLRYVDRHRLEAVAELAGCSLATAKRRIVKAQRFLAEHFVSPAQGDA
jgi:RNA polymerase sigma-70 factor (ECF subfamily)